MKAFTTVMKIAILIVTIALVAMLAISTIPLVTGGVNVEFVQVLTPNRLRMRVWERGSGVTLACGTGACASATAAVNRGLCPRDIPVEMVLDGGSLFITVRADGSPEHFPAPYLPVQGFRADRQLRRLRGQDPSGEPIDTFSHFVLILFRRCSAAV